MYILGHAGREGKQAEEIETVIVAWIIEWFWALNNSNDGQQVETVGDKYMAVSGLPDACQNHAACIARLALDMIEMADSVKMGSLPIVSTNHISAEAYEFLTLSLN